MPATSHADYADRCIARAKDMSFECDAEIEMTITLADVPADIRDEVEAWFQGDSDVTARSTVEISIAYDVIGDEVDQWEVSAIEGKLSPEAWGWFAGLLNSHPYCDRVEMLANADADENGLIDASGMSDREFDHAAARGSL